MTGLTNQKGQLCRTYQYSAYGEITFGASAYENEYTYNGESYNPNIKSQYLRARYYNVVTANFLTEDSYLGRINEPLTLNRYTYCVANPVNYRDPSGHGNESLNPPSADFEEYKSPEEILEEWEASRRSKEQGYWDAVFEQVADIGKFGIAYIRGMERFWGGQQDAYMSSYYEVDNEIERYLEERSASAEDISAYYAGRCEWEKDSVALGFLIMVGSAALSAQGNGRPGLDTIPLNNGNGTLVLGGSGTGEVALGNSAGRLLGSAISGWGILKFHDNSNTKHGDQRLKERGFIDEKVADIMENYSQKVYQEGGRTVYAKKSGNYYDVIITNADGEIVTAVGGNTKSLRTWKDVIKMLNNNGGYSMLPY